MKDGSRTTEYTNVDTLNNTHLMRYYAYGWEQCMKISLETSFKHKVI